MDDHLQAHFTGLMRPRPLLLIDDSETDRSFIRDATVAFSCDWFMVDSIHAAFEVLKGKAEDYFSAVFLDLRMPTQEHGITIYRTISERYPELGVVILSGSLDTDSISRINRISPAFFLEKPHNFTEAYFTKIFRFMGIPRKPNV